MMEITPDIMAKMFFLTHTGAACFWCLKACHYKPNTSSSIKQRKNIVSGILFCSHLGL